MKHLKCILGIHNYETNVVQIVNNRVGGFGMTLLTKGLKKCKRCGKTINSMKELLELNEKFYGSVISLQAEKKIDTALDAVYQIVRPALIDENGLFDLIVADQRLNELQDDILIGLLVVSRKFDLPSRKELYDKTVIQLKKTRSNKKVDRILGNLM